MKIERTCKIELSADEVRDALTKYIRDKHRYDSEKVKSWEVCLSFTVLDQDGFMHEACGLIVEWGEKPDPIEPPAPLPSVPDAEPIELPPSSEPAAF